MQPEQPPVVPQPVTEAATLKKIEEHLASIRYRLGFFVLITVLYIIFSIFGALLSF